MKTHALEHFRRCPESLKVVVIGGVAAGPKAAAKMLGAQAVGPGAGDKRMDLAAMAITAGMTVDQLSKVDLCYARLKSCKGRDSSACG